MLTKATADVTDGKAPNAKMKAANQIGPQKKGLNDPSSQGHPQKVSSDVDRRLVTSEKRVETVISQQCVSLEHICLIQFYWPVGLFNTWYKIYHLNHFSVFSSASVHSHCCVTITTIYRSSELSQRLTETLYPLSNKHDASSVSMPFL